MKEYLVSLLIDEETVDETSLDEFSFQLAYDLFIEFGHENAILKAKSVSIVFEPMLENK